MRRASSVIDKLRSAGPYMLIELLLPGGTLLAFLLWLSSGAARGQFAPPQLAADNTAAVERLVGTPFAIDAVAKV